METEYIRPSFLASYFEAMRDKSRSKGWWAIIPYWQVVGATVGAVIGYFVPDDLWTKVELIIALNATVVVFNGLLLALSWSAFSRIHELIVSSAGFSIFLRRAKLFNTYIFYIDFVQATQLLALLISGMGLFVSTMHAVSFFWQRVFLAATLASTIYAVKYAVNAVTVMHDLVWQKAIFEEQEEEAAKKVVRLGTRQAAAPEAG